MNIDQLRKHKEVLETEITSAIERFEKATEVQVTNIDIDFAVMHGINEKDYALEQVDIKLNI